MDPVVILGFMALCVFGAVLASDRFWELAAIGETVKFQRKIRAADERGSIDVPNLVIGLVVGGILLIFGIGMMSESMSLFTAPDCSTNPEAYQAYTQTQSTIWKAFRIAPMTLFAMVLGAVVSAIIGAFYFRRG